MQRSDYENSRGEYKYLYMDENLQSYSLQQRSGNRGKLLLVKNWNFVEKGGYKYTNIYISHKNLFKPEDSIQIDLTSKKTTIFILLYQKWNIISPKSKSKTFLIIFFVSLWEFY